MRRDSFVFYRSFFEMAEEIADERERLRALEAILDYGLNGRTRKLQKGSMSSMLFGAFKPQIDANNERYMNGKKGGAPKGNKNAIKQPVVVSQNNQRLIEKQPNENVNVNANVNANVHVKENVNDISSPISTELSEYIRGIERKRRELAND